MKVYKELFKNTFQSNIIYKINTYLRIIGSLINLSIQISIWNALLKNSQGTNTSMGMISLQDMTTYVIISIGISIFTTNNVIWSIDNKIKTGTIAIDLIKPMNLKLFLFTEMLGNNVFRIIFEFLPILFIGVFFLKISFPALINFILFLITMLNGFFIYFLIAYAIGLIGFWYMQVWQLGFLLTETIKLFSGSIIPLWFFPKEILTISAFLPFKLIFFAPLSIYLEKVSFHDALWMVAQQFFWILALFFIGKLVWNKAIDKLIVQGG